MSNFTISAPPQSFPLCLTIFIHAILRNAIGGRGIVDGRPVVLVERPIARVQAPDPAGEAIDTADDREPPLLAVVEALPERSPLPATTSWASAIRASKPQAMPNAECPAATWRSCIPR